MVRKAATATKAAAKKVSAPAAKRAAKAVKSTAPVDEDEEILSDDEEATSTAKARKAAEVAERKAQKEAAYAEKQAEVVRLKDEEGLSLKDISAQLELNPVTAQVMYIRATTERSDKKPTPTMILQLRDDKKMGWARIGAMFGMTKAQVQKMYKDAGHDPHMSFIGKGGRYGSYEEHRPAKAEKPKATKATKATKAAASGNGKGVFADPTTVTVEQLTTKLNGKTIEITKGDGTERIKVANVGKVGKDKSGNRLVQFQDGDGKTRNVRIDAVVKVGR